MKLSIMVRANSKQNEVRVREDGGLLVLVNAPPTEDKANKKVIEVLSKYLGKPKSHLTILHGRTSRHKVIEVQ